tara:strand:+ start:1294 stop:2466 length:1173 start_codon:yes stop_codon:yes gene_type:complete
MGAVSHVIRMTTQKKLNKEEEREAALTFLCGVNIDYIHQRYDISNDTIRRNIVRKRSRGWNDPLIEFYRQTSPYNKDINSAHMFLSFQNINFEPKPTGLIDSERDRPIYDMVNKLIYTPKIEKVIKKTALKEYMNLHRPYDNFLGAILGRSFPKIGAESVVNKTLIQKLSEAYEPKKKILLGKIFYSVGNIIIDKVREGGLVWTDLKKSIVHKSLEILTDKEKTIIGTRFGLDGYGWPKSLDEIGKDFSLTKERIRQIELRSLNRLGLSQYLKTLEDGLMTDNDLKNSLDQIRYQEEKSELRRELYSEIKEEIINNQLKLLPSEIVSTKIDELDVSIRTLNCLNNLNVKTIGELSSKTEKELIKEKNLGIRSLREIKEILGERGIFLRKG